MTLEAFGAEIVSLARGVLHFLERHHGLLTAAATIAIAAFTYTLWRATNKMWLATKQAADAAMLSAKAAVGVELPIVRAISPELLDLDRPLPEEGPYAGAVIHGRSPGRYSAVGHLEFRNDGRTPAFPVRLEIGHRVVRELQGKPAYDRSVAIDHGIIIPAGGAKRNLDVRYQIELFDTQIVAIENETARLWLYCNLAYSDFMSEEHEAAFCWYWGRPDKAGIYYFASDPHSPTAYRRKT